MGRVASFTVNGIELLFYSSDHRPPHFHARSPGKWEIRVNLHTTTAMDLDWSAKWPPDPKIPAKILNQLRDGTVANRVALLLEWEEKVQAS